MVACPEPEAKRRTADGKRVVACGLRTANAGGVKTKKPAASKPNLVVPPPPPETPLLAVRSPGSPTKKRPSDPREKPAARDSHGKAGRVEIRREEPRRSAPRTSARRPERGNQPRSHKAGGKK